MGKAAIAYARKLDALRHCPILMQYHHQENRLLPPAEGDGRHQRTGRRTKSSASFLAQQRDHALTTFEALHVLYVLAKGIARFHALGEYHGDIHDDNIMIRRRGNRI